MDRRRFNSFSNGYEGVRKVIVTGGNYVDYFNEIQTSPKLGFQAYRIAPEKSSPLLFTYEQRDFCLGPRGQMVHEVGPEAVMTTNYLVYWKEGTEDDNNITAIKGGRGIQGKRGAEGDKDGPGSREDIGERGLRGDTGEVHHQEQKKKQEILDQEEIKVKLVR